MKRVILSGATGYFGSLAKKYFEGRGFKVISAGRGKDSDIFFDMNNPASLSNVHLHDNVDLFVHAAAINEVDCVNDPYGAISGNVSGTKAALEFCVSNEIKDFYYISTFHVYGTDYGVVNENVPPRPVHDYGLTHLLAEEYVRMYTRKGLINGVSLRPSNMFDVPISLDSFNRWSLIPFLFCKSAVDDNRIVLNTPGFQQRNFVSVQNIIDVIEMLSRGDLHAEVINIPGVSTLSIRHFAELVKSTMREKFDRLVVIELPTGALSDNELFYESLYLSPHELGFTKIDEHVEKFCKVLIGNE